VARSCGFPENETILSVNGSFDDLPRPLNSDVSKLTVPDRMPVVQAGTRIGTVARQPAIPSNRPKNAPLGSRTKQRAFRGCADVIATGLIWKTPLGFSSQGALSRQKPFAYSAASFSFFSGRTLRRTEAGFAANHLSSPVNGSLPKRFFLAGTSCATTFSKPGSVNSFAPFL
jgi:hypothetical protein